MRRSFLIILILGTILTVGNVFCFAQTNSKKDVQAAAKEKLKKKVEDIGIGGKITVIKLNDEKFFGKVNSIEADGFQISEVDSTRTIDFRYVELKKVQKGDGERNLITGKRNNPSAKRGLLYGAALVGGLIVLVVVGLK